MLSGRNAAAGTKLVLVLSENWTLTLPRDLRTLVSMAVEAEEAGFDAVMVSEHVVLGPGADAEGLPANPRDYALPGNQDPETPWPSSLVLLSAIASATTRLRLAASAVIAPLRHPLLLAKDLATLDLLSEGRLVVQPTVSWHRPEYEALGVPFEKRGELLDEHLAAWDVLWRDTPASFEGRHYRFRDVYLEPKPWRPDGPKLWFGGASLHDRLLRRLVRYGHGFNPLGSPTGRRSRAAARGARRRRARPRRARARRRHARPLPGPGQRGRPGRGARRDPGTARPGLHVDLHQAVAVHRRSERARAPGAGRSWREWRRSGNRVGRSGTGPYGTGRSGPVRPAPTRPGSARVGPDPAFWPTRRPVGTGLGPDEIRPLHRRRVAVGAGPRPALLADVRRPVGTVPTGRASGRRSGRGGLPPIPPRRATPSSPPRAGSGRPSIRRRDRSRGT